MSKYLFGPVTAAFAESNLALARQAGACLAFNADGDSDLVIRPSDDWEKVRNRFPVDWQPDFLVLNLPYMHIPACLWTTPLPKVALANDWQLLWHSYRLAAPHCELVLTDTVGAEHFAREGIPQARPAVFCGLERTFAEESWSDEKRDIDILFVGNLNPAVQRERSGWLQRLAGLGKRRRVHIQTGTFGDSYRKLLKRAKIVFQYSTRGKCGRRSFEAAAAGALIFQEAGNRELPAFFRDGEECVYYRPSNFEELVEYYLDNEEERRRIAKAAHAKSLESTFDHLWDTIAKSKDFICLHHRASASSVSRQDDLLARAWQAMGTAQLEDATLIFDLERTLQKNSNDAASHNTLGAVLARQANSGRYGPATLDIALEHFRKAVRCQPEFVLARLNLADTFDRLGQKSFAAEAARKGLDILHRTAQLDSLSLEGVPVCQGYDTLRVEWEKSAWANAGGPVGEAQAKQSLIRWRLHSLLARWTSELPHHFEAALSRPELALTRTGLADALFTAERPGEAVTHLRQALATNPLDFDAARMLFHAQGTIGDADGQRALAQDRRLLARALPSIVPREPWFSEPKPRSGDVASIVILCCNQVDYTRQCLDALHRHTRSPYEVIFVDNGSTDGTSELLEEFRRQPGPARVEVIRNETNVGFGRGCNQALARARGRYFVFLHNDTIVTPGWLESLVRCSLHDWPNVGLVGPVTNAAPEPQCIRKEYQELSELEAFATKRRRSHLGRTLLVRRLTSFCMLVRREVIDHVGPFDERFSTAFFEDDDLCLRAREAGYRICVALDQFVHHHGNRTIESLPENTRELLTSNFELFKAKWGNEHTAGFFLPSEPVSEPLKAQQPAFESVAHREASEGTVTLESGPKVTLSMIVRNEEKNLPDCLKSVAGLFDEIVIVDTGSTDRTKDIALAHGARVFDFPWVDSFGAARNESLKHARGKWVMWLDADDRLDAQNFSRLREVLGRLDSELDAYAMKVRSAMDTTGKAFRLLDQVRLFRNLPGIQWDYRIHEQILPAVNRLGGGVRWANVIVDHVGYQDPSARKHKLDRNLRLLEMDETERPDDSFALFNLGWTLLDLGRTADAMPRLKRSLEIAPSTSSILRKVYHLLTVSNRQMSQPKEALSVCQDGLRRFPDDGELLLEQGLLLREQGELDDAHRSWLQLLEGKHGNYFSSEEAGMRGYKTRQLLAETYLHRSRLVEAEIQWRAAITERPDFEPAGMGLGEIYLRQSRWTDLEDLIGRLYDHKADTAKVGWLKARGQAQRKQFAAALTTLEEVISLDPQAVGPRVLLSHILIQAGNDWGASERALLDILELDPNNQEAQHNLRTLRRNHARFPQPACVTAEV